MSSLSTQQIILYAALLVAVALVLALVARALLGGKKKPPAELPAPPPRETVEAPRRKIEVAQPQLPPERLERERVARAEMDAAASAISEARARSATAEEVQRLTRAFDEAQRRLDYEVKKREEAEAKALRKAEGEAQKQLELEEKAAEEERKRQARLREQEAQQARVDQESGRTLSEGLAKTRGGFMARLNALLGTGKALDESVLGELEEILFSADVGVRTATSLLEAVRERLKRNELSDLSKVKSALREEVERILKLGKDAADAGHGGLPELAAGVAAPQVVMVIGVNGTGKTTTIGKLASKLRLAGKKVLLGAGDTFRAAAGEQLDVWAERAQVPMVRGKDGSDPGAVLFDAVAKGKADGMDIVLCDTAGRLHTKASLMDELKAVKRTLGKAHAGAPHEVLLVVDATTGQNAIQQARIFHDALGVTGFVLTKLDGTAKGGVIIGICDELKIPVRYVGIGEKAADLKPFDAHEFVQALFE